jgi:hypothetical protein
MFEPYNIKEARTANMRFASCGVTCLHSSSVFQLGFSAGLTVSCSEIANFLTPQNVCSKAFATDATLIF